MMKRQMRAPRGFTLIEVLIAATVSLVVITMAVAVGVQLQRRGLLEERTVETQNAARAARDLMAASIQRAGVGMGSLPVAVGSTGAGTVDLRYAVWPTTAAQFTDGGFAQPSGIYEDLASDALDVWELDPSVAIPLKACMNGGTATNPWTAPRLCTSVAPPVELEGRIGVVVAPATASRPTLCLGRIGALDRNVSPPGDVDYSVQWTPGLPGRPTPASHPCGSLPTPLNGTIWAESPGNLLLMPLNARSYRVNWAGDTPTLEMDPDGFAGDDDFIPLSRDIERLQVRLGVMPTDQQDSGVLYFPDPAASRPPMDQCTHALCSPFVTWDAGVTLAGDEGPGSARDQLMRRVRLVEVELTARSQRVDRLEGVTPDGGIDEDGNINDGFKRRHSVIRLAPRNFGFAGQ